MRRNILLSAFGQTKPLTEWAEQLGINEKVLRTRIERGWDHWKALTPLSGRKRTSAIYTLDGFSLSVTEWADRLGIPANTIFTRISRGWPIEMALFGKR